MMIFLIEYDRPIGQLLSMQTFDDSDRSVAEGQRIALEIERLHAGIDREIVILEAASEADLRRTHRRYFETLEQLASTPGM